jgi:hypothetical protein
MPLRPNLIGTIGCAPEQQALSHMQASNWRMEESEAFQVINAELSQNQSPWRVH